MPQPPMENVKTNNLIGEKSVFEGRFLVNGAIQINGKFEGEIVKVDQVNVGRTGRVKSNIDATSVVIEGIVIGNIKSMIRAMLLPTARVLGDIRTPELIIQNGVVLEAKVLISPNPNQPPRETIMKEYDREN